MSQRTLRGTFLKKVKTSGFRSRMASKTGRRVINARRKKGRAKLEIAVAKGKKSFDKRQTKKTRDWNRDKARYFRRSS